MTFFPVVERELRVASRQSRTFWSRALWAGGALFLVAWVALDAGPYTQSAVLAQRIYWILATITFLHTFLAGVGATSDSISEEKREGTLGLLFLTDLRGWDIILGKLAANSLRTVFGLLAIFPIIALPLLLGGVTMGDFLRLALFLLVHLYFCLGVGMVCSTLLRDERRSLSVAVGLVLAYAALPSLIGIAQFERTLNQLPSAYYRFSPVFGFIASSEAVYLKQAKHFWECLVAMAFIGTGCFGISAFLLPKVWRQSIAGARLARAQNLWSTWKLGDPAERSVYRRKLLEINPVYWLSCRDRLRPWTLFLVLGLLACGWGIGLFKMGPSWFGQESLTFFGIAAHLFLKGWFAIEAPRLMMESRQSGALELMLTTPLSTSDFLRGAKLAFFRDFGRGFLLLVAIELVAIVTLVGGSRRTIDSEWIGWAVAMLAVQTLDMVTIGFLGLWRGLNAKSIRRATTRILLEVVAAPWVVVFLLLTLFSGAGGPTGFWGFLVLQLFAFFVVDILLLMTAADGLTMRLRQIAANRFDKSPAAN